MQNKINCPCCLFSSGIVANGKGSKCDSCNGTGKVTQTEYIALKEKYGDLIKTPNKGNCHLKEFLSLTKTQQKIYLALKDAFSATKHTTLMDVAIQNGINFQLINKH